jgi:hypothetical protein
MTKLSRSVNTAISISHKKTTKKKDLVKGTMDSSLKSMTVILSICPCKMPGSILCNTTLERRTNRICLSIPAAGKQSKHQDVEASGITLSTIKQMNGLFIKLLHGNNDIIKPTK